MKYAKMMKQHPNMLEIYSARNENRRKKANFKS